MPPATGNIGTVSNLLRGSIVIDNLPEGFCFESFSQLLQALPQYLAVLLPTSITNVIISNVQPGDDQRDSLWIRRGNDGGFIGIYVYALGQWRQITPVPQGVFWMYGDSRTIPEGYILVDNDNPHFTTSEVSQIQQQFVEDPTETWFTYFATTFEGF